MLRLLVIHRMSSESNFTGYLLPSASANVLSFNLAELVMPECAGLVVLQEWAIVARITIIIPFRVIITAES